MVTSRFTCGFYTTAMCNSKLRAILKRLLPLFLLACTACKSNEATMANLFADPSNGLIQVKKANAGTIVMQVMPGSRLINQENNNANNLYSVKLALRRNDKIKGAVNMQYMNFGIKNFFYAVEAGDTLPCIICERIPGINEKEYVYMTFFNKPRAEHAGAGDFRLLVADTIAGFGLAEFIINKDALKKLAIIKQQQ